MSFLGPCNIGDVVLMQSFTSWSPDMQVTRRPKRTNVAVFVLLGTQPKDGSAPLDLEAAMKRLGWVRESPRYFWFGVRRFPALGPSMTVADIKKMVGASPDYLFFQVRPGQPDLGFSDSEFVDLTDEPHFWAAPAATMRG